MEKRSSLWPELSLDTFTLLGLLWRSKSWVTLIFTITGIYFYIFQPKQTPRSEIDPSYVTTMPPAPKAADDLLAIGQKRRIYIPEEVELHNCVDDIWVIVLGKELLYLPVCLSVSFALSKLAFFYGCSHPTTTSWYLPGNVYDLTALIKDNMGPLAKPLIEQAGTDLSYLFDAKTGDPKTWVEPITNLTQYYLPCGRFIHVPPSDPAADWEIIDEQAWWRSEKYLIGEVSIYMYMSHFLLLMTWVTNWLRNMQLLPRLSAI